MIEFQSVEDILKFAIEKEEASYLFYTDLGAAVDDTMAGRLFQDLAQEELRHREQLLLEIMKTGKVVDTPDDWADRSSPDYVLEGELPKDFNCADVLKLAINKEQAAYKLYIDLIRMSGENQEAVDIFMALAKEEVRHKLKFEAAYESYMRQER